MVILPELPLSLYSPKPDTAHPPSLPGGDCVKATCVLFTSSDIVASTEDSATQGFRS